MQTIVIRGDSDENLEQVIQLAERLGIEVKRLSDQQSKLYDSQLEWNATLLDELKERRAQYEAGSSKPVSEEESKARIKKLLG